MNYRFLRFFFFRSEYVLMLLFYYIERREMESFYARCMRVGERATTRRIPGVKRARDVKVYLCSGILWILNFS
jgi:hypothetical protein